MLQSDVELSLSEAAAVLKAAGEPSRLRILKALEGGELCGCHLVDLLGVAQPTVSRHLSVLRNAGLVAERKEGRWSHYRLEAETPLARGVLRVVAGLKSPDPNLIEGPVTSRDDRKGPLPDCSSRSRERFEAK